MKRSSQQTFNNACDSQRSRQLTLRAVSVPKITVDLLTPCHEKFTILILSSLYALFRHYLNHLTPTGSVLNYQNFFLMVTSYLLFCLPSLNQSKMYTFVSFVSLCIYLNEPKRRKGKKPPVPEGNSNEQTRSFILQKTPEHRAVTSTQKLVSH